ncbi:MAG: protoglobin family protein [Planctomycetales bacterium]
MKHIDEELLETDSPARFQYLAEFIGFTPQDDESIKAAAPHLAPLVPTLVDAVYDKLFRYDATKRHFVPQQSGYHGPLPADLEHLTQEHPQIQFRKEHLGRYLVQLVTRDYDAKFVGYLDMVGKIHTPKAGSSDLDVPLVQMNALMGFVSDTLTQVIASLPLDPEKMLNTIRAFNKLLWIQNDFITRHYQERSLLAESSAA